jgi:hypothetical protein
MRRTVFAACGIILAACAAKPSLTPAGERVVVVSNLYKPQGCEVLDVVSSRRNYDQGTASGATIDIRNEAAAKGANAIYIISTSANVYGVVTVTAEALKCRDLQAPQ